MKFKNMHKNFGADSVENNHTIIKKVSPMAGFFSEIQINQLILEKRMPLVIFFDNQQNYEIVIKYGQYYNYR
jgi:hypothetical protein